MFTELKAAGWNVKKKPTKYGLEHVDLEKPSFEIKCKSNNPGASKWYVDIEKCYL